MYAPGKLDLAGFCVGIVDRSRIIDGAACRPGDRLIGLASSGLHSNGYSLVRKILSPEEIRGPLSRSVLRPTRIYVRSLLEVGRRVRFKALAHITGGGLIDNLPRVFPSTLSARIHKKAWKVPAIFRRLQEAGGVRDHEMYRTFNMGIGLVAVTSARASGRAMELFREQGEKVFPIGELIEGKGDVQIVD
jgi:phosphoribosylformylglycinamidine cyclo-ligase